MPATRLILGALAGLIFIAPAAQGKTVKTIQVDCSKGDRISRALEDRADELTLEITGICEEDVRVDRENVVLRGSDPALDGIRGAAPDYFPGLAVLTVRNVERFRIEKLAVTDGWGSGMRFDNTSYAYVVECRVEGNRVAGIQAPWGQVFVTDTAVRGSLWGLVGFDSTFIECVRCTVTGNSYAGVAALADSRVSVIDSEISSPVGLSSAEGSQLWVEDSTVEGTLQAISAGDSGQVTVSGSDVSGPISVASKGLVRLDDASQVANPAGENSLELGSALELAGGSSLQGDTTIDGFSRLLVRDTSLHDGDLICSAGGDSYCDDPTVNLPTPGSSSNCDRCPKP